MGSLCIIIGIVFFLLFSGGGYLITAKMAGTQIMGQSIISFIGFKSTTMAYIVVCGACAFIGLLLCFTFVMIGLNSKKISQLNKRIRKLERSPEKKKSKSAKAKSTVDETMFEAEASE